MNMSMSPSRHEYPLTCIPAHLFVGQGSPPSDTLPGNFFALPENKFHTSALRFFLFVANFLVPYKTYLLVSFTHICIGAFFQPPSKATSNQSASLSGTPNAAEVCFLKLETLIASLGLISWLVGLLQTTDSIRVCRHLITAFVVWSLKAVKWENPRAQRLIGV